MSIGNVVDSLVNTLLVKPSDLNQGKALLFELELKLSSYEDNERFNARRELSLLYNKLHPNGSYISVFSYEGVASRLVR